ncbi:MAG: aminomethyl transferase family protein [Rhodospirillales bacterium]|jgi:aminomethyltransferase|nr:aminomethyl transferase family protein [Rhodospirillales bacterium]MBT4039202.1 aminomethyl transferase family protein [Rhodospirillales bacterium]MBT4625877.1 aminomethyl transferase family protein [Rhodospirillales bacterium]MBT5350545.1 aminomethyl transferase family protein [Rhodospirillales bacterium]MBT5522188.1 aminomethyl transferase family protein [Rhodospirillales bacterium]
MAKRVSALDATLRALGGEMGDWNGMELPYTYPTDRQTEMNAVREAIGMWDTSALNKIHVRGTDAMAAVDYLVTRDMSKVPVGKSVYSPILQDNGHFYDDSIVNRLADDHYLVAGGIGPTLRLLEEDAKGRNVSIEDDDDMHVLAVQGPKSLELLDAHTSSNLGDLVFSYQIDTDLFGKDVMISRTGFSGERGYEIFTRAEHVVEVWQGLMEHGQPLGLMPMSVEAIEYICVESGLLLYGAEATEENTPWETDMGWAISRTKDNFRGKKALFELEGKEKVKLFGIVAGHDEVVDRDAELFLDGEVVGRITTPAYSDRLGQSLALVHLIPSAAKEGTKLELKGSTIQCSAVATSIPFYDPKRERLHAV